MRSHVRLIIIATISAIVGGVIALSFGNAEAQPAGAKQIQFVLTGQAPGDRNKQGKVERWEDPEYGIVCYIDPQGGPLGCAKK